MRLLISPHVVILYNCAEVALGCSSCTSFRLVEGYRCGWCGGPTLDTDGCTLLEECSDAVVNEGSNCPAPVITDFNPKSGPIEGGTTITITGRELGISFNDFDANSITVGNVRCALVNKSYIPGRQILCTTEKLMSLTNTILIRLHSEAITSNQLFRVATPEITRVVPARGPVAGGTRLTLWGSNLNIGNIEDTRITIANRTECVVE